MDNSILEMFSKLMNGGFGQNFQTQQNNQFSQNNSNRAQEYYPNDIFSSSNQNNAQTQNYNNQNVNSYNSQENNFKSNNQNQFFNQNPFSFFFDSQNGQQNQFLNILLSMLGGKNLSGISDIMSNFSSSNKSETQSNTTKAPKDDIIL